MSSWASNSKDKLIFDNWRSYLNEQKRIPIFKTIEDMVDNKTLTLRQGRALLSRVIPDAILTAKVDRDSRAKIDISMLGIEGDNLQKVKDNIEKLFNQSDFKVDVVFDQDTQPRTAPDESKPTQPQQNKSQTTDKDSIEKQKTKTAIGPLDRFDYQAKYSNDFQTKQLQKYLKKYVKDMKVPEQLAKKHLEMFADLFFRSSKLFSGGNKYTGLKPPIRDRSGEADRMFREGLFQNTEEFEKHFERQKIRELRNNLSASNKKLFIKLKQYFENKGAEYFAGFLKAYQARIKPNKAIK